jgi:hypothetical protein
MDHCNRDPASFDLLSPYCSQLADGFSCLASAANDRDLNISSLVLPYQNDIARARVTLAKLPSLPSVLRSNIDECLMHFIDEATSRRFQLSSVTSERRGRPKTLFVSYAHEDERFKNLLKSHLAPLVRTKLISEIWDDREIFPGEEWKQSIAKRLDAADLILLLISPDFFKSDFCYLEEFQTALRRQRNNTAIVIPVVVRPVHWAGTPIAELQLMPQDGLPITEWTNSDLACVNVVEGIVRLLTRTTH